MSNTSLPQLTAGTTIDNKYRIDCLIGQGGMGKVFRVTHVHLSKVFALKLMNPGNQKRLSRFRREAEALAKINHPNVVAVTDFGVINESPYIVMDYLEGMTLRFYLKMKGTLTEKEAIAIGRQVCAALHMAHNNNIVHRDLKPENIMIQWLTDGDMIVRVVDFGLAKLAEGEGGANLTEERETLGTLKYMPPEQLYHLPLDQRADIFSFCLIMYEMLTGQVPQVAIARPRALYELRPEITLRLSDIIMRGLSQQASERPESISEVKKELETAAVLSAKPGRGKTGSLPTGALVHPAITGESPAVSLELLPPQNDDPKRLIKVGLAVFVLVSLIITIGYWLFSSS
jgi:eukaryotic-like serine/threonine-protein kinase